MNLSGQAKARNDRDSDAPVLVSALTGQGLEALLAAVEAGDHPTAVALFRKTAYLNPASPITHLHLGLALEASGDLGAKGREAILARVDSSVPARLAQCVRAHDPVE